MLSFEQTHLWRETLKERKPDEDKKAREKLRSGFLGFRENAVPVAEAIKSSYPWLTVHDITHIDALWGVAELIIGKTYPLNPAEAFVLGGAFLIHDLGNGLAAYQKGPEQLRGSPEWKDALAARIRRARGRAPTAADFENPPADLAQLATEDALRALHASHALRLVLDPWKTDQGKDIYMLEETGLREHFGELIGEVAYSHWWDISELERKFAKKQFGAMVGTPRDWTVDVLKVACILRVADAAHIDKSRAPTFLQALLRPQGVSKTHWDFQNKLSQTTLVNDRLLYSASQSFNRADVDAFWLCFDTLRMVDRELRQVDALLASTGKERFRARSVAGVDDPRHLTESIPTDGWTPMDARIHVTDVPTLVGRLGGIELYGNEPTVPLRELIQNAADAVRARRALEKKRAADWGTITVRTGQDKHGPWIEVEDTGVGMSEHVLTHHLLDFGSSYWSSEDMRREHRDLAASSFEPTGRFGIGFFATFMWGHRLSVTSRAYRNGKAETKVLEFEHGLKRRPLLRPASEEEQLDDGGTRVRVWLSDSKMLERVLRDEAHRRTLPDFPKTLAELVACIAPTLDVSIDVESPSEPRARAVTANDWKTLDPTALLRRLGNPNAEVLAPLVSPLLDATGQWLGRGCLVDDRQSGHATITVGGLRADYERTLAGVLLGFTDMATRNRAQVVISTPDFARWATEQARAWEQSQNISNEAIGLNVLRAGGEPGQLPIAHYEGTPITMSRLQELAADRDEVIILFSSAKPFTWPPDQPKPFVVDPLVLMGAMEELDNLFGRIISLTWGVPREQLAIDIASIDGDDTFRALGLRFRRPPSPAGNTRLH